MARRRPCPSTSIAATARFALRGSDGRLHEESHQDDRNGLVLRLGLGRRRGVHHVESLRIGRVLSVNEKLFLMGKLRDRLSCLRGDLDRLRLQSRGEFKFANFIILVREQPTRFERADRSRQRLERVRAIGAF